MYIETPVLIFIVDVDIVPLNSPSDIVSIKELTDTEKYRPAWSQIYYDNIVNFEGLDIHYY
jgi:hypothetical protein